MKCPHCGTENPDNGVFCVKCNKWILAQVYVMPEAPVPEVPAEEPPAKKSNRKVIIPTIAAICVVILGVALLLPGPENPTPTTLPPLISTTIPIVPPTTTPPITVPADVALTSSIVQCQSHIQAQTDDDYLSFILDQSYKKTEYAPDDGGLLTTSLDGLSGTYLCPDGTLIYICDGKIKEIAREVYAYAMSTTGNAVAYANASGLHLQKDGHVALIDDLPNGKVLDLVVSEYGNSVAYHVSTKVSGSQPSKYIKLYHQGTVSTLTHLSHATDMIGVADSGQWLYLIAGNSLQSLDKKGNITRMGTIQKRLIPTTDNPSGVYLPSVFITADHSQVLFRTSEGTQLSINGQMGTLLSLDTLLPIMPALTGSMEKNGYIVTCPYYDLSKALYYSDSDPAMYKNIHYLDKDLHAQLLLADAHKYWLDPTGQQLFCLLSDGRLQQFDFSATPSGRQISADVYSFAVRKDCSAVYYVAGKELRRCDANGDSLIRELTWRTVPLLMTQEDVFCYYFHNTMYFESDEIFEGITWWQADCGTIYLQRESGAIYSIKSSQIYQVREAVTEKTSPANG